MKQTDVLEPQATEPPASELRPTLDALKAADPLIFQRVPGLEDIVRREQQFSETFATVADARHAARKAADLDLLRASLAKGDPSVVLTGLTATSPDSLSMFVENFLPAVDRVSGELFARAVLPVFKYLLQVAQSEGATMGDETLTRAADRLARHFCRTETQVQDEEAFNAFTRELKEELYARLERLVHEGIHDPNGALNGFTRRAIVKEVIDELSCRFGQDTQLGSITSSLRDLARDGGLVAPHKEALLDAHLSRARPLVPAILDRIVADAVQAADQPCSPDWDHTLVKLFRNRRVH